MTSVPVDRAKISDSLKPVQSTLASSSNSVQPVSGVYHSKENNGTKEQCASRSELLAELSNATLVYLACIVKHDGKQLSTKIDGVVEPANRKKDCDEIQNQLDQIFRSLSAWKKTLLDGRLRLIADEATTTAVDVVMSALLIIAHQLTHLASLTKPWLATTDHVFRTVLETLQTKIKDSQNEESRVDDDCPMCDKKDSEKDNQTTPEAYLAKLDALISDLKEDSKPLQVVLSRLEKYDVQRATADFRSQKPVRHESRTIGKRVREDDTATSARRGSLDKSKTNHSRNNMGLQDRHVNSLHKDSKNLLSEKRGEKPNEDKARDSRPRKVQRRFSRTENDA